MDSSNQQEPSRRFEFHTEESVTFHLSLNGRHLTRLARLLRPIQRPIYRWLVRRQEKRWKASNRDTT
jgi:hypothetical protein